MGIDTRKPFLVDDKITNIQQTKVTYPLWTNNDPSLIGPGGYNEMLTSSTSYYTSVQNYYTDVYHKNPLVDGEVQFSVSYIHVSGSGSSINGRRETQAMYTQIKNTLGYATGGFVWNKYGNNNPPTNDGDYIEDALVISVNKDRYLEGVDPCAFQLTINGYDFIAKDVKDDYINLPDSTVISNRVDLIEGTLDGGPILRMGTYKTPVGWLFPQQGLILLKPRYTAGDGYYKNLGYEQLNAGSYDSASFMINQCVSDIERVYGRSYEIVYSNHFFARLYHDEFNYSSNPTWAASSAAASMTGTGSVVYVTTIGLYVTGSAIDGSEDKLVAVAKLSRPLKKTETNEAIIRIKLDY